MINNNQIKLINSVLLKLAPKQIGILELLGLEKTIADKLGYPVEIVNEKNIKNEKLKYNILNDLLIIYPQMKNEF